MSLSVIVAGDITGDVMSLLPSWLDDEFVCSEKVTHPQPHFEKQKGHFFVACYLYSVWKYIVQ